MYKLTHDWFAQALPVWEEKVIPNLPAKFSFLEIGSYEGRSAIWTVENMLADGGGLTCIDFWEEPGEHVKSESYFDHNVEVLKSKYPARFINKIKATSYEGIAKLITEKRKFDFIYLDGNHIAKNVMTDACMLWPLLREDGGIFVFDDYAWDDPAFPGLRPKVAVDMFYNLFGEEVNALHVGYQVIFRKTPFIQKRHVK
jgi:predicted O-methyltransferase YrrM